jgi:hypothetical protein
MQFSTKYRSLVQSNVSDFQAFFVQPVNSCYFTAERETLREPAESGLVLACYNIVLLAVPMHAAKI